jgi:hypothetical protein
MPHIRIDRKRTNRPAICLWEIGQRAQYWELTLPARRRGNTAHRDAAGDSAPKSQVQRDSGDDTDHTQDMGHRRRD